MYLRPTTDDDNNYLHNPQNCTLPQKIRGILHNCCNFCKKTCSRFFVSQITKQKKNFEQNSGTYHDFPDHPSKSRWGNEINGSSFLVQHGTRASPPSPQKKLNINGQLPVWGQKADASNTRLPIKNGADKKKWVITFKWNMSVAVEQLLGYAANLFLEEVSFVYYFFDFSKVDLPEPPKYTKQKGFPLSFFFFFSDV